MRKNLDKDCSNLRRGAEYSMDCLERNAKKLCPSCKRYDREERMRDLQEDLDSILNDLEAVEVGPGNHTDEPSLIDVTVMFFDLVGVELDDMSKVRRSTLVRVARRASQYGIDDVANILRKHLELRKAA